MNKDKEVVTVKRIKDKKRNKTKKYSIINVLNVLQERYFGLYDTLSQHTEGCLSGDMYGKMDAMMTDDYNNSINNLEFLSKKGMKYLKKKDSKERNKIFWYKFRRFFGCKINDEIEQLILRREKFNYEMAKLFEDPISSSIRKQIEEPDLMENSFMNDEEPDYVTDSEDLMAGQKAERIVQPEIVDQKQLEIQKQNSIEFKDDIN